MKISNYWRKKMKYKSTLWKQRQEKLKEKIYKQDQFRKNICYNLLPYILEKLKKGILTGEDYYCIKEVWEFEYYRYIFEINLGLKVKRRYNSYFERDYVIYYTKRNVEKIEKALIEYEKKGDSNAKDKN